MNGQIQIPASELQKLRRTLEQYTEHNKRDRAEIVTVKGADWAFKAIGTTEKADGNQIAMMLGQTASSSTGRRLYGRVSVSTRTTKKGKQIQRVDQDVVDTYAARIINARLVKKGEKPVFGKELVKRVRAFVGSILKSIGFVKGGWLAAAKSMQRRSPYRVPGQSFDRGGTIRGRYKGDAQPARPSDAPSAVIINSATKDSPRAAKVAEDGLVRAIPVVIADMNQYIEKKMQQRANKELNAK